MHFKFKLDSFESNRNKWALWNRRSQQAQFKRGGWPRFSALSRQALLMLASQSLRIYIVPQRAWHLGNQRVTVRLANFSCTQSSTRTRQRALRRRVLMWRSVACLQRFSGSRLSLTWHLMIPRAKSSYSSSTSTTWTTCSARNIITAMKKSRPCSPSSTSYSIVCSRSSWSPKSVSNCWRISLQTIPFSARPTKFSSSAIRKRRTSSTSRWQLSCGTLAYTSLLSNLEWSSSFAKSPSTIHYSTRH